MTDESRRSLSPGQAPQRFSAVRTRALSLPLHSPFVTALRRAGAVESLLVEIDTTGGGRGRGEAPQVWQVTGESVAGAAACVEQMLAPLVVGRLCTEWRELCDDVQRAVARNFGAKAAVETALCDLVARDAGVPMATVLASHEPTAAGILAAVSAGSVGVRSVATDVTISAGEPAAMAEAAAARVASGFTHLKLKVGADLDTDLARVRAVRAAIGDLPVRLDANQAWTPSVAVEMIDALAAEGLDVEFVEQPVLAADIDGLAWVRARSALPIVADEAVFSMADLERVIAAEAADGVNVKLAKCGGPLRAAALVRRAQDAGLATMVGSMMEGPVGVGAAAEVALAVGCSLVNDLDAAWWLADLDDPDFGDVALTYEAGRVVLGRSQRPDEPR